MKENLLLVLLSLWAFFVTVVVSLLIIGSFYQTLRFLVQGETKTISVTGCSVCYSISATGKGSDYLVYTVSTKELKDNLILSSNIKMKSSTSKQQTIQNCAFGVSRQYAPKKNWCEIFGKYSEVIHYDRNGVTIIKNGGKLKSLISHRESVFKTLILSVTFMFSSIIVLASYVYGLKLFLSALGALVFSSNNNEGGQEISLFDKFNSSLLPATVIVLTISFIIMVGVIVGRSLFIFDIKNTLLSGFIGIIGLGLTAFGPFVTLRFVGFLKGGNSKVLVFARNLAGLITAGYLLIDSIRFYRSGVEFDGIGDYFRSYLQSLIG